MVDKTEQETIADVFDLPALEGEAAESADKMRQKWLEEDGEPAANEPSVGIEGEGAGDVKSEPAPSSTSTEPEDKATAPKADPQPAAQPAAPQPASDPRDTELAALRSQVEALTAAIKGAQPQPSHEAANKDKDTPAQPQVVPIPVQLPQQLLQDIFGEDPAKAFEGMNALVSNLATGLNHRFTMMLRESESRMDQRFAGQEQASTQRANERTAAEHRANYFKAFPDHNKPVIHPLVAQAAAELAAADPNRAWDEDFQNSVGARVNEMLMEIGGKQPAPARPAPMLPESNRSVADTSPDIISETFGFG